MERPEEDGLRWFAERIIAGEFENVVIAMVDNDGITHTFHEGQSRMAAIGLAEWAAFNLKNQMLDSD